MQKKLSVFWSIFRIKNVYSQLLFATSIPGTFLSSNRMANATGFQNNVPRHQDTTTGGLALGKCLSLD